MPTLADSAAPPLQITVLEGPLASVVLQTDQSPGVLVLTGRQLPYGAMLGGQTSFEGRQRIKATWYAGNTRATLQVMGPVEEPTSMNGMWKDLFLGVGAALQLVQTFDAIRRTGPLLKVEWGPAVRIGMLEVFKWTPVISTTDIQWDAKFVWAAQDEKPAALISATGIQNPREGLTAVATQGAAASNSVRAWLEDAVSTIVSFPDNVLGSVDMALSSTFGLIQDINDTAGAVSDIQALPLNILQRGVGVSVAMANSMRDLTETMFTINPGDYLWNDLGSALLDFKDFLFGTVESADAAAESATETAGSLEGQLVPELIAEIRVPPGTDLRDLAMQYYGDPDDWYPIAVASGFRDSVVPSSPSLPSDVTSFTVRIPRRASGAMSDLSSQGC